MTDRPKTAAEIAALPIGPAFGQEEIKPGVFRPVMPEVKVLWFGDDEVMGYTDANGDFWLLGQYANGSYYRKRVT